MQQRSVVIRPLKTVEEVQNVEELQFQAWHMPDYRDAVPVHLLVTAQKNGGLLLGAFDGDQMVGFLFGFLGTTAEGMLKHCSHMLAVLPAYRAHSIGEKLKLEQRRLVAAQGISLITWTYDPLEFPNANLNIRKLGATSRTYLRNIYGKLSDTLNQGLPTDRLQVDWQTIGKVSGAGRGDKTLKSLLDHGYMIATETSSDAAGLLDLHGWQPPSGDHVLVEIPVRFQALKIDSLQRAQQWRFGIRALFDAYFAAGYAVTGFIVDGAPSGWRGFYVLERSGE